MSDLNEFLSLINKSIVFLHIGKYKFRIYVGHYPRGSDLEKDHKTVWGLNSPGVIWRARITSITPDLFYAGQRTSMDYSKQKTIENLRKNIELYLTKIRKIKVT